MSISFMISALLAVSLLTNLTVEGIKKLLDESNVKYSSNVLAAIFSTIKQLQVVKEDTENKGGN